MFERFTERARRVVVHAQEEARDLNHGYIGTEHLLLGLMREPESAAARALRELEISQDAVRDKVVEIIGRGSGAPSGHIPFTPRAKKVLELSLREALQLSHNYIGTEHILLGLIREGQGVAAKVLTSLGGDLSRVRDKVIELTPAGTGEARAQAASVRAMGSSVRLEEILHRLDTIGGRLAAIERHLGIEHGESPASSGGEEGPASSGDEPAAGE
jgi:ATP-dependent Clp protease ATP-binding subunit ClpC